MYIVHVVLLHHRGSFLLTHFMIKLTRVFSSAVRRSKINEILLCIYMLTNARVYRASLKKVWNYFNVRTEHMTFSNFLDVLQ